MGVFSAGAFFIGRVHPILSDIEYYHLPKFEGFQYRHFTITLLEDLFHRKFSGRELLKSNLKHKKTTSTEKFLGLELLSGYWILLQEN